MDSSQNKKRIYLAEATSKRRELFSSLINLDINLELVTDPQEADFKIFFDKEILKLEEESVQELVEAQTKIVEGESSKTTGVILDITDFPPITDSKLNPLLSLCTMCASFITCANDITQEDIYMNTGRLAAIIDDPYNKGRFKEPAVEQDKRIKKPHILWFGTSNEIFQVRKDQVASKTYKIETYIVDKEATKPEFKSKVEDTDIIYLPKAFDEEGEAVRKFKTHFAILEGKFVIAPEMGADLAFDGTLQEGLAFFRKSDINAWVKMKQKHLLEQEGELKSLKQFNLALDRAFNEDFAELFLSDFEDYLDDYDDEDLEYNPDEYDFEDEELEKF